MYKCTHITISHKSPFLSVLPWHSADCIFQGFLFFAGGGGEDNFQVINCGFKQIIKFKKSAESL